MLVDVFRDRTYIAFLSCHYERKIRPFLWSTYTMTLANNILFYNGTRIIERFYDIDINTVYSIMGGYGVWGTIRRDDITN